MITTVAHPSISQILATDQKSIYRIPRYQREYIWGQWNWNSLYDDVFESEPGYFLGSIIVIQGPVDPMTGIYEYEVIDGQQRLTTISLLLAAMLHLIEARKDALEEEERYVRLAGLRNRLVLTDNKKRMRVIPQVQNFNLDDYGWVLREYAGYQGKADKPKHFGLRRISRALQFFIKRLESEVEGMGDAEAARKLIAMSDKLLNSVLVQINVDSHADAYTLFASLNNRGVPLTAVDLIKNTLLAKLSGPEEKADDEELDFYFDQWQEVLRRLGDDTATQERFFRQNYDAFRREANKPFATGASQLPLGSVATRSNLLSIYERRISDSPGALGVLDELLRNSELYARIIGTDEIYEEVLEERFERLGRAQGVPSYVLLLYVLRFQGELGLLDDDIAEIVDLLVRFFVRRNVTDTPPTRDLERLFISICEDIEAQGLKGRDVYELVYRRLVARSAPNDVFKASLQGPIYDVNPDVTRFILTTLAEPSVTKEMKGLWERYPSGNYVWTIEHIFPQGQNIPEEWIEVIGGGDRAVAQEIQSTHVHTLGNLTITGYNSKLSNLSFIEKRDRKEKTGAFVGYRNGLNLNEDLVSVDEWTKESIEKRTAKLVDRAMEAFRL